MLYVWHVRDGGILSKGYGEVVGRWWIGDGQVMDSGGQVVDR